MNNNRRKNTSVLIYTDRFEKKDYETYERITTGNFHEDYLEACIDSLFETSDYEDYDEFYYNNKAYIDEIYKEQEEHYIITDMINERALHLMDSLGKDYDYLIFRTYTGKYISGQEIPLYEILGVNIDYEKVELEKNQKDQYFNYMSELKNSMKQIEKELEEMKKENVDFYEFVDYVDKQKEEAEMLIVNNKARNSNSGDMVEIREVFWLNLKGFYLDELTEIDRKNLKEDNQGRTRQKRTYLIRLVEEYTFEEKELKFSIILKGEVIDEKPEIVERVFTKYID